MSVAVGGRRVLWRPTSVALDPTIGGTRGGAGGAGRAGGQVFAICLDNIWVVESIAQKVSKLSESPLSTIRHS